MRVEGNMMHCSPFKVPPHTLSSTDETAFTQGYAVRIEEKVRKKVVISVK